MFFIKAIFYRLKYVFLFHYFDWLIDLKKYDKIMYELYGETKIGPDIIYSKFVSYTFIDDLEQIKFFTKGKKVLTLYKNYFLYSKKDKPKYKIKPIEDKYLLFINARLGYTNSPPFSNLYFGDLLIRFDNQYLRDKFIMEIII